MFETGPGRDKNIIILKVDVEDVNQIKMCRRNIKLNLIIKVIVEFKGNLLYKLYKILLS